MAKSEAERGGRAKGDTTVMAASEPPQPSAGPSTFAGVFGEVVSLLIMPVSHKHLFLADLEWLVVPPLKMRQFRLWRQDDRPVAFASWAFLSEEVEARVLEARVLSGLRRLKPNEWKSGDRAWLMDVVAPRPETAKQMIEELKRTVFPDRPLKVVQQTPDGGSAVAEY
jgi:cytolysin-activating lysine-acyltransferase